MENLLVAELMNDIGKTIVFWKNNLRFEGKILAVVDETFLKYYDTHKDKERFVRLSELNEWEVSQ